VSKAYLLPSREDARSFGQRYSIPTLLLGWWSLGRGIGETVRALRLNREGGLDVTDDVRAALTEESLQRGEVVFTQMAVLFEHASRDNARAITKALTPVAMEEPTLRGLYLGLFVNTPVGIEPYFFIGVEGDVEMTSIVEKGLSALRKPYRKDVPFEFIGPIHELWPALVDQGERIYTVR
jgi:hypothetical protein